TMKDKSELLCKAEELIRPLTEPHIPDGTEAQAVIDQWLHAVATDSQFFCDSSLSKPEDLKNEVISILRESNVYKDRNYFFKIVFGKLQLKPSEKAKFTFIDLFAGIGGMRLGFQNTGGVCVFSSEFDKHARLTYQKNHGEPPFGDITLIDPSNIPKHDILLTGFPCQPFSHSGLKLGI